MNNSSKNYQVCSKGIWDTSIPDIWFDQDGISNYAKLQESLSEEHPKGEQGKARWNTLVANIKAHRGSKEYDCIIGVSGGTDSSYLLHIAKKAGLKPLAVNLDNGWSSDISVKNIKKVTGALGIDLETYVIDYEEVKDVLVAYMKAGLPWVDTPTDLAIKAVLYKIANREKIKYILNGADFRSEGKQPMEWTYGDAMQFKTVLRRYGNLKLKTFPKMKGSKQIYYSIIQKIKMHRPLYYLDYNKSDAQNLLINTYGWEYYGGHHHENIFTKFAISYWLPRKFGIDKRIITLSAQILNGALSRDEALEMHKKPPYDLEEMEKDKNYVIKKLGLSTNQFEEIFKGDNKFYYDYPSYLPFIKRFFNSFGWLVKFLFPSRPIFLSALEQSKKNEK